MAKALFNSPRYEKKKYITQKQFGIYITIGALILYVPFTIFVVPELLAGIFYLPLLVYAIFSSFWSERKFKYKAYTQTIQKQNNLFHSGGKTQFIANWDSIESDNLHFELTLRLLATVMKADKEERVVEMEVVKSFILSKNKQYFISKLNKFKKYLKEDYSVEDVAFAVYWWYDGDNEDKHYDKILEQWIITRDKRKDILRLLFELAYADGDFCENEEYLLRYIAYHMRLTNSDYENVLFAFLRNNYKDDNFKERVEDYMKTRYKRDGGYWCRDRWGNKQWHSIPKDEDEKANEESKESENTPHISTELEKAYAVLGIPVDATPSEINACKRNLLRRNHPDLVATRGQEAVAAATAKCQTINQAYELLKANGKC